MQGKSPSIWNILRSRAEKLGEQLGEECKGVEGRSRGDCGAPGSGGPFQRGGESRSLLKCVKSKVPWGHLESNVFLLRTQQMRARASRFLEVPRIPADKGQAWR